MNLHHIGIEVKDIEQSRKFYEHVLGFQEETYFKLNDEKILFLKRQNFLLELIQSSNNESIMVQRYHLCFETESFQFIKDNNLTIYEGPIKLENGWETVFIKNSDGELVEFLKCTQE